MLLCTVVGGLLCNVIMHYSGWVIMQCSRAALSLRVGKPLSSSLPHVHYRHHSHRHHHNCGDDYDDEEDNDFSRSSNALQTISLPESASNIQKSLNVKRSLLLQLFRGESHHPVALCKS